MLFIAVLEQDCGDHTWSVCWTLETVLLLRRSKCTWELYLWQSFPI